MLTLVASILLLIGIVSPLLTFATFAQQKEWRFDRIRVALQEEGGLTLLVGKIRLVIFGLYWALFFIPYTSERASALIALGAFAALSMLQFGLKRQRLPTFTQKAKAVLAVSTVINLVTLGILLLGTIFNPLSIVLVLVQPLIMLCGIVAVRPLDAHLKKKIYRRTRALRSTLEHTTVIAITGSVGKTTCKHILAQLLSNKDALITPKFVNTELGICNWFIDAMQRRTAPPQVLVVEMGAYRPREIALMCSIFKPNVSIVTHIGTQHLALFGSQEALLNAKAEILEALPEHGHALFPGDLWYSDQLRAKTKAKVHTVGLNPEVDIQITDIQKEQTDIRFSVNGRAYGAPITNTHLLYNIVLAMSAASLCDVSPETMNQLLPSLHLPDGTFTVQKLGQITVVDDSHNSSPSSFKAAIEWAKDQAAPHKVLITSGLIEQGKQRAAVHQKLGKACSTVFDRLICTEKRAAKELEVGFGTPVELLKDALLELPPESLVVCEGRVPMQTINKRLTDQR